MSSTEKLIDLLEALAEAEEGMGVLELSKAVRQPPATTHRLLRVLLDRRFVLQDPEEQKYSLGPAILHLTSAYQRQNPLVDRARPLLKRLSEAIGESVFLAELIDGQAVCVATAEASSPTRFFMRLGQQMPMHASASGRALIAQLPPLEARRILGHGPFTRFTERTVVDLPALERELSRTRKRGYAICAQEVEVGVSALAAPVFASNEQAVASISIVAPHQRLSGTRRQAIADQLLRTARELSSDQVLGIQDHRARELVPSLVNQTDGIGIGGDGEVLVAAHSPR